MGTCCSNYLKFKNHNSYSISYKEEIPKEGKNELFQAISHIKVFADSQDILYPIWCQANTNISFKIEGKWGIFSGESINYKGLEHLEQKNMNWPIGCLIGFMTGMEHYFKIEENQNYVFPHSGCLYLTQNTGDYATSPSGYLDVIIIGGIELSLLQIEKKLGWDFDRLYTCDPDQEYHNYLEQNLIYEINKLRLNSKLYASQYLKAKISNDTEKLLIYNFLVNSNSTLLPLEPLIKLQIVAQSINSNLHNYLNLEIDKRNNFVKNIFSNSELAINKYGEQICFQFSRGINILSALLFKVSNMEFENIRRTLLNSNFNKIGVSILKNNKYDWSSVICLAQI